MKPMIYLILRCFRPKYENCEDNCEKETKYITSNWVLIFSQISKEKRVEIRHQQIYAYDCVFKVTIYLKYSKDLFSEFQSLSQTYLLNKSSKINSWQDHRRLLASVRLVLHFTELEYSWCNFFLKISRISL